MSLSLSTRFSDIVTLERCPKCERIIRFYYARQRDCRKVALSIIASYDIHYLYPVSSVKCIGLVAHKIESAYIQTSGSTRNWSTAGAVHRMRRWIPFVHLRLACIGDARTKKSKTANNNEHEGLECVRDRELAKELVFDSEIIRCNRKIPREIANAATARVR